MQIRGVFVAVPSGTVVHVGTLLAIIQHCRILITPVNQLLMKKAISFQADLDSFISLK
jgi:nitrate reductase gamma subunit